MARRPARRPLVVAALGAVLVGTVTVSGAAPATAPAGTRSDVARQPEQAQPTTAAVDGAARTSTVAGGARLGTDARGRTIAVLTRPGHPVARPAGLAATARATDAAAAYLHRYGGALGVGAGDLGTPTTTHDGDALILRYPVRSGGLPVFAGQLVVALDRADRLTSMTGRGTASAGPFGSVTATRAAQIAVGATAQVTRVSQGLRAGPPRAVVYDPALVGDPRGGGPVPAWQVQVTGGGVAELVLLDSRSGVPMVVAGQGEGDDPPAYRTVCDYANRVIDPSSAACTVDNATVRGSSSLTSPIGDVQAAYDNAQAASTFYNDVLGVNLTSMIGTSNGQTRSLRLLTRICVKSCPYVNSMWLNNQAMFGADEPLAADIVAHELTHGVTQHVNGLAYVFSSGAINESMSDVFGELSQQWNAAGTLGPAPDPQWLIGEQLPGGALRSMSDPNGFNQPGSLTSPLYQTSSNWTSSTWDGGGVHRNSGVGNQAAYLIAHGGTVNGISVPGLGTTRAGLARTAQIYYRTQQLLPSGSSYADLGYALQQACSALAGSGTAGITAAQCGSVAEAVAATRMLADPSSGSPGPGATPVCAAGLQQLDPVFTDSFDAEDGSALTSDPQWTFSGPSAGYGRTGLSALYASSGGDPGGSPVGGGSMIGQTPNDAAPGTTYNPAAVLTYAATSQQIALPAVAQGQSLYLRFTHVEEFEFYSQQTTVKVSTARPTVVRPAGAYDGGRVRIVDLTNAARSRALTSADFVDNPYDTRLLSDGSGSAMTAFGGYSSGYLASRVNLAPFAGDTVQLVFQTVGDQLFSSDWFVDDVQVYLCQPRLIPDQVTDLTATTTGGGVQVSWQAAPGAAANRFVVTSSTGDRAAVQAVDGQSSYATTFDAVPGAADATFTVTPVNGNGSGPPASVTRYGALLSLTAFGRPGAQADPHSQNFAGRLSQPGTGGGLPGATVSLWFCAGTVAACTSGGSWTSEDDATVLAGGSYRTYLPLPGPGSWQARYAGSDDRAPAVSSTIYVPDAG